MTWILSLISGAWARVIALVVGLAAILAAVLSVRASIRRDGKRELSESIQRRTLERIEEARRAQDEADRVPDADIRERLRDMGYLRDGD